MMRENLLPQRCVEARRVGRAMRAWACSLGLGLVVVAFAGIGAQLAARAPRAMPVGIEDRLHEARGELALAMAELDARDRAAEASRRSQALPDWGALLSVFAREGLGRVVFRAIRIQPIEAGTWSLSIVGHADDRQRVTEFRAGLEATGLFADLKAGTIPSATQQGRFEFQLDGRIRPGASQ